MVVFLRTRSQRTGIRSIVNHFSIGASPWMFPIQIYFTHPPFSEKQSRSNDLGRPTVSAISGCRNAFDVFEHGLHRGRFSAFQTRSVRRACQGYSQSLVRMSDFAALVNLGLTRVHCMPSKAAEAHSERRVRYARCLAMVAMSHNPHLGDRALDLGLAASGHSIPPRLAQRAFTEFLGHCKYKTCAQTCARSHCVRYGEGDFVQLQSAAARSVGLRPRSLRFV